jgi:hypothetical protein
VCYLGKSGPGAVLVLAVKSGTSSAATHRSDRTTALGREPHASLFPYRPGQAAAAAVMSRNLIEERTSELLSNNGDKNL